jgi:hypothetical protein
VQEMEVLVDNKSQPSILGSGLSGTVTLDQAFFPSADCLHTIEIRARFLKKTVLPPSCLSLADPVLSGPSQIWSTSYSECTGPVDCNKSTVGLPIDVATGKMYYEMADLVIRGPLPIELVRRYDSQSTFNGPLGFGWSHNYLMRLAFPATGRAVFVDGQGREIYFSQRAGGAWVENKTEHLVLTQLGTPA